MQSPKRGSMTIPARPTYLRVSLPVTETHEHDAVSSRKGTRDLRNVTAHDFCESNGEQLKDRQNQRAKSSLSDFVGFGAPHPKLTCGKKKRSMCSLEPVKHTAQIKKPSEKSFKDDTILKSAEQLIQHILQDENATINHETIRLAMQQNATWQAKKR